MDNYKQPNQSFLTCSTFKSKLSLTALGYLILMDKNTECLTFPIQNETIYPTIDVKASTVR